MNYEESMKVFLQGGVSPHYFVTKEGKILQLVDEKLKAWHAGLGNFSPNSKLLNRSNIAIENNLNSYSLGIEIENSGNEPYNHS